MTVGFHQLKPTPHAVHFVAHALQQWGLGATAAPAHLAVQVGNIVHACAQQPPAHWSARVWQHRCALLSGCQRRATRQYGSGRCWTESSVTTRLPLSRPRREVVERGLPELLAAAGNSGGVAAGAGLGEQLAALQPAGFRALLAAIHAVTRACLRHFCACVTCRQPQSPACRYPLVSASVMRSPSQRSTACLLRSCAHSRALKLLEVRRGESHVRGCLQGQHLLSARRCGGRRCHAARRARWWPPRAESVQADQRRGARALGQAAEREVSRPNLHHRASAVCTC